MKCPTLHNNYANDIVSSFVPTILHSTLVKTTTWGQIAKGIITSGVAIRG